MQTKTSSSPETPDEFDKHVERYLSMIMHHDEVQLIAEAAKRVFRNRLKKANELSENK